MAANLSDWAAYSGQCCGMPEHFRYRVKLNWPHVPLDEEIRTRDTASSRGRTVLCPLSLGAGRLEGEANQVSQDRD